jgi:hypothetical protein
MESGVSCVHFFMHPGIYKVILKVTDTDGLTDTVTLPVRVSGEAAYPGFELWHAPYASRLAQYLYAQIPSALRTGKLKVSLTGDNGYAKTIYEKTGLQTEEKILLTQNVLPKGNYTLLAEVWNGTTRVTYIKEKFQKSYDGNPIAGINENNAICVNGQPYFPVTAWLLDKELMPNWQRYINTAYGRGYYAQSLISNWTDYLDNANQSHLRAIGPERWEGKLTRPATRNSNLNVLDDYITPYTINHPAQLMWMWVDEPNLGGRDERIPAPVLSSWTNKTHQLDLQHPVVTQYYGFDYLKYYNPANSAAPAAPYNFMQNEIYFGKKHNLVDMIGFDIYPIEYNAHASFNPRPEGIFELWLDALDTMQKLNYSLLPTMDFIETQDLKSSTDTQPGPTPDQIRMEIWSNIAHNVKGINWFQYFDTTPPENYGVMEEFLRMITELTPVILGPESGRTVTDNANVRGNRVDTFVRETATDIYLLAVRITEPDFDCIRDGVPVESNSISVSFSISGLTANQTIAYDYFDTKKSTYMLAGGNAGTTYNATLSDRPVPGSVVVYGLASNPTSAEKWVPVFDNGSGKLSGTTRGKISSGTIDYSTSRITVTFGESIQAGTDKIKITYLPVRSERTLTLANGSFTDSFQRCAVHIYRIPK